MIEPVGGVLEGSTDADAGLGAARSEIQQAVRAGVAGRLAMAIFH
jgi:hypothetical protein